MKTAIALSLALLAGCANYKPIVDMQGVDQARYSSDLAACQQYATQVSAGENAAAGAVAGAVLGAILGAIIGNSHTAGQGAALYGVIGGAGGAGHGAQAQINVVRNCMNGRGYRVLQ